MNWYEWIADSLNNKSILLVGENMESAIESVYPYGASRIGSSGSNSLSEIKSKSFDYVVCLDMEYSVELSTECRRISKNRFIYGCENTHSLDEDLLKNFDELWAGSILVNNPAFIIEKRGDSLWSNKFGEWTDGIPIIEDEYLAFIFYL